MQQIGQRMKSLREASHLSQAEIAKLCGSNQTTIAKTETGKTTPSVKLLLWWADYFNVSMDYLCCRTDNPQGVLYEPIPPDTAKDADIKQFVDLCFDPTSSISQKLRETLTRLLEEQNKEQDVSPCE